MVKSPETFALSFLNVEDSVTLKDAVGYLFTPKKSSDFKCPTSF